MRTDTHRFRKTAVARALITALCGTGAMMAAQVTLAQTSSSLQRVEITGSAIKRTDAETAVPITVLRMDNLKEQGLTTVEEVVNALAGNQATQGTSQAVGLGTGGASFADLRGLGRNKTLVLLNGRRITNNAIDSSAPDLNTIPFAAIDRVEVLRDGASSLYGTDAIGGVVNFITRKDFTGGTASIEYSSPQHSGGKAQQFNIGYGVGDLEKSNFNVFGFLDYQKQDALTTLQRDFGGTKTSGVPYPGVYFDDSTTVSPFYATGCNGAPFGVFKAPYNCRYLYWKWVDDIPESERLTGMLKGTLNLPGDHQLNLEYFVAKTKVIANIAPVPYSALTINPGTKYYPGNGITPPPPAAAGMDLTQPLGVNWRDIPNGPRQDTNKNTQQRLVASLDGTVAGWDYSTALTWGQNKVTDTLTNGYSNGDIIGPGIQNGIINPFSVTQDAAGQSLLDSANARGELLRAKGTSTSWDGKVSRELGDWMNAGRKVGVAVGAEVRHERMEEVASNPAFAQEVIASTGFDPSTNNAGSRTVWAAYGELNVPVMKTLDVTGAVRYDHYSDFGSTVNPKVSFRFQPSDKLLVRGSASTGFRAPSLYDLHQSAQFTNTANPWDDPVRCPGGHPIAGAAAATNCETQFMSLQGGNTALRPETSKNVNLGFVIQPVEDFDATVDFWWIKLKHQIGALADDVVFGDPATFAALFRRAPDGSLSTSGSQCPGANCGYVLLNTQNLGGVNTNGVDLSLAYRMRLHDAGQVNFKFATTYVNKFEYQQVENGPWFSQVSVYSNGNPVFRWQHNASVTWSNNVWSAGLVGRFKSGYLDEDGSSRVGDYLTWDIFGSWKATKAVTITAGVRNVFDTKPPSSVQGDTFQVGYDPRFADPLLRTFYLRGTFRF
jgi:iron complex outermembrane recepter protein